MEDRTGIRSNKISEIRKELIDHGIVALTAEQVIIDWERVQIFASLEKPLPKHGNHTYAPVKVDSTHWSRIPLRKTRECASLRYRNPLRKLADWEENFFDTLEQMTAEEYHEIVCGMGVNENPPKEGYITYIPQPDSLPGEETNPVNDDKV